MQAALMTFLTAVQSGAETTGDTAAVGSRAAGQGMRINSALQSRTNETLFTTILQKGISIETMLGLSPGDNLPIIESDAAKEADGEESSDICSLLMQLMVMNSAGQGCEGEVQSNSDEKALGGISGTIAELPGATAGTMTGTAASLILQKNGGAEAVFSQAAIVNPDGNQGQPIEQAADTSAPVPRETVLAGITDALKNELAHNGPAAETTAADDEVTDIADIKENMDAGAVHLKGRRAEAGSHSADTTNLPSESHDGDTASLTEPLRAELVDSTTGEAASDIGRSPDGDGKAHMSGPAPRDKDIGGDTAAAGSAVGMMPAETSLKGEIAEKTAAVERALNSFADDITSIRGDRQEIRIVLEPESLGTLTISVIKTERGISAKIRSEDREVAAVISDHVQKLISTMESKGITVSDVDVAYNQTEQNAGFAQRGFSQAREHSAGGNPPSPEKNSDDDAASQEPWQTLYGSETVGDTKVDYRV